MTSEKMLTPIEFARSLRRKPTSSELALWQALRDRRRTFKFRRQRPIGPFTADFLCVELKLVIESDGKDHFTEAGQLHDDNRDRWMKENGYSVLRFTAHQIDHDLESVLKGVDFELRELSTRQHTNQLPCEEPSPPPPSPGRPGEGASRASSPLYHSYGRGVGGEGPHEAFEVDNRSLLSKKTRSGFTLVELLVVVAIIGILSGLVIQALNSARQDALAAKTRATIAKIDSVLSEKMDEYLSTPLRFDVSPSVLWSSTVYVDHFPTSSKSFVKRANTPPASLLSERVRTSAVRDLMRLEMPDRAGDLYLGRSGATPVFNPPIQLDTGFNVAGTGETLRMALAVPSEFRRIHEKILSSNHFTSGEQYLNEELLFLIVEGSFISGSPAIEAFGASEIADTDGDGLSEFIDAWRNPIRWIRWPTGLSGSAPFNPDPLNLASPWNLDAFDPAQADIGFDSANPPIPSSGRYAFAPNYFPKPLVVSPGPDARFGIRFYWRSTYLPTPALAVYPSSAPTDLTPVLSAANVVWPLAPPSHPVESGSNGSANAPTYASPIKLADPFHPRFDMFDDSKKRDVGSRYRLGGGLNDEADFVLVLNKGEVQDVALETSNEFSFRFVPQSEDELDIINSSRTISEKQRLIEELFQSYAGDNISNLDESGAAL
jgi:prepilin-type N-terminal cleavage/methylation domain-containing protein